MQGHRAAVHISGCPAASFSRMLGAQLHSAADDAHGLGTWVATDPCVAKRPLSLPLSFLSLSPGQGIGLKALCMLDKHSK